MSTTKKNKRFSFPSGSNDCNLWFTGVNTIIIFETRGVFFKNTTTTSNNNGDDDDDVDDDKKNKKAGKKRLEYQECENIICSKMYFSPCSHKNSVEEILLLSIFSKQRSCIFFFLEYAVSRKATK